MTMLATSTNHARVDNQHQGFSAAIHARAVALRWYFGHSVFQQDPAAGVVSGNVGDLQSLLRDLDNCH